MKRVNPFICLFGALIIALGGEMSSVYAYIGPGAGFAFLGSFVFIIGACVIAVITLITLPIRILLGKITRRKFSHRARVKRIIILGLDGFDPELAEEYMDNGLLPHLSTLREKGHFSTLRTTNPPISPVAWSTFMTGVNPGKHAIFDFLAREPNGYQPVLSSARIRGPRRVIRMGNFFIPCGKPRIQMLRKSIPFWKILGDHGITGSILNVPITFPPEKCNAYLLSGLCTPDCRGTQGTFTFFKKTAGEERSLTGGYVVELQGEHPVYHMRIPGPFHPFRKEKTLSLPGKIKVMTDKKSVMVRIAGCGEHRLEQGQLSDWIPLSFRVAPLIAVKGIVQFFVKEVSPELELYMSPVNIDPEHPSLPVSHPLPFSVYLSKVSGRFATLGLPQDTWALNEGVLTDEAFLQQTYGVHNKLEEIFFHMLRQVRKGVVCAVFDTTDAVQHVFWRYLGEQQPALRQSSLPRPFVIRELYKRMDLLTGSVMKELKRGDLLIVLSDHGFKAFTRGINLNTWLYRNGFLHLKDKKSSGTEWFENVDWKKTRAYALGLAGIYINRRGREPEGIVEPREVEHVKKELVDKLLPLEDAELGRPVIASIYDTTRIYKGPYRKEGPDLIVGYYPGYRVSWESVTGELTDDIFVDNDKAWSADHCIDHRYVPGVIFSNCRLRKKDPGLEDCVPTVLELFGVERPGYLDGESLDPVLPWEEN